jgi:hypothetical protein
VEYGDEWFPWFPDLTIDLHLEEDMRELTRLCAEAGREPARVTVVLGEPDEAVLERCEGRRAPLRHRAGAQAPG